MANGEDRFIARDHVVAGRSKTGAGLRPATEQIRWQARWTPLIVYEAAAAHWKRNRRIAVELLEMTWPQVAALSKDMPVVVPVAALEQHGRHMPLFTDSLLLGDVLRRVKEPMKDRVLFAPLMWLGNSHHHLDFPGTLS